ncbi:protein Mabiki [Drosophila serrata]|uniref:protein Mabiki n=1 Tax=Drosophila serrata TaxID=7274 RepID=UPI000A1D3758|nr:protein Mabiki [Drosophila serrata]
MQSVSQLIYRHKKFDVSRSIDKVALLIKEELITRSNTPCSISSSSGSRRASDELSSSMCFSDPDQDQFLPLPKRRRLLSSTASVSSEHSLPSNPISVNAIRDICKYHVNMVRKFPKKERTPKEQERRDKNTMACRLSRRKKKIDDLEVKEEYDQFLKTHHEMAEQSLRAKVYLDQLKLLVERVNHCQLSPRIVRAGNNRRNFSIDFLIGSNSRE